jgi:hypothetical protein
MLPGVFYRKMSITPFRAITSTFGIIYVWCLPLLSYYHFAEPNATSISGFIANPPATGAMAAFSFMPLTLMWEYQDNVLTNYITNKVTENVLFISLSSYQLFYGCFLVCTENYVPLWLHQTTVSLFGISFVIHALLIICTISTSKLANIILGIGILSFISLLYVDGMWFWACECTAYSSMILYTPILWYYYVPDKDPLSEMVNI